MSHVIRSPGGERRTQTPAGIVLSSRRFPRLSWHDRGGAKSQVVDRRTVVGASVAADIVIDDATVSRLHVELDPRHAGLWIRDLESRNGTRINGVVTSEIQVAENCTLTLGTTDMQIDYSAGAVAPVELWPHGKFQNLVGESAPMRELFAFIARIGPTEASVLIQGETGTGKEMVARAIHETSHRNQGPYVVVDCAALPENLLDAELFGHTRGAFTGAHAARAGAIETADGGTVFLDEIGEVPLSMQPKLLRVLEQRTVRRIGESNHRPVNVRFVTATHRDLLSMVARGEFREDLYFRLCVIPLTVPALRDRREDVISLVEHFLNGERLSARVMEEIKRHPWRGNVRELRNFVERARALGDKVLEFSTGTVRAPQGDVTLNRVPSQRSQVRKTLPPGVPGARSLPSLREPESLDNETQSTTPISQSDTDSSRWSSVSKNAFNASPFTAPIEDEVRVTASGRWPAAPIAQEAPRAEFPAAEGTFREFRAALIEFGEREFLRKMLEKHKRNINAIAKEADVDRTYIYRLLRRYGL
jgi:two-component system, NtrC family, response regulator GlrR